VEIEVVEEVDQVEVDLEVGVEEDQVEEEVEEDNLDRWASRRILDLGMIESEGGKEERQIGSTESKEADRLGVYSSPFAVNRYADSSSVVSLILHQP
jgi:hypothetical protein